MGKLVEECTFLNLDVEGDINVTGNVDGVDISAHVADTSIHYSHANKTNLDVVNQNLGTANTPTFAGLAINGNVAVTGLVDGVDVSVHAGNATIHHTHGNKANLDTVNQNLGTTSSPTYAGLTVSGNMTVTGTVNGVNVAAHAARHQTGGADALTGNLDANARVQVLANGTAIGTRRAVHFSAGPNITLSAVDSPTTEAVILTVAASSPWPQTVTGVAGETLPAYALCYLNSDGKYYRTNAATLATMPGLVLAGTALTAGQSGSFIRRGLTNNSSWAWATIGGFVYADSNGGGLTQTAPSASGNQLQIVGLALSATQIDFDPQLVLVEVA
jgi:hypothetical protein